MKFVVVAVIILGLIVGRRMYVQWQARLQRPPAKRSPRVPSELLGRGDRTWVVFTTPYCASCEPVRERLAAADPAAAVLTIDATRRSDLAGAFRVRTAPTTLLADGDGRVLARLVGADAVADYLRAAAV